MVYLLLLLVLSVIQARLTTRSLIGGNSDCGRSRVRKSWDDMSSNEQSLYRSAISTSIERGLYHHFVKVHMERRSEIQAHNTCGFILWHRRYLLAFENMLRSLSSQFRCVTIPYWNTMDHFKNLVDGRCSDYTTCSSILEGLGGPPGAQASRTFNGRRRSGNCHGGAPYEELCDDNGDCGCMIRDSYRGIPVGQANSYASLFNLIAGHQVYDTFTLALKDGVHITAHNDIGGFMSSFASPIDALFFSWHATIDMLLSLWHRCHVSNPMTNTDKSNSAYAFNQERECRLTGTARAEFGAMDPSTAIYMRADGSDIRSHSSIGRYFRDVGTSFAAFADSQSMGDYTYSYDYPRDFNRLLGDAAQCHSANNPTPAPPTPIPVTPAPATTAPPHPHP